MPEVRFKPSLLLEVSSHTAMGVAVDLAFAFLVTHITALGIATLISYSPAPDAVMLMFVGTCAITFGIGATLTGLAITILIPRGANSPLRQERQFHNRTLRENCKKISGQTKSAGSMAQHYEFVIDFQNALGRLYIRYLNPPRG